MPNNIVINKWVSGIVNQVLIFIGLWIPFLCLLYLFFDIGNFGKRRILAYFLLVSIIILFQSLVKKKFVFIGLLLFTTLTFSLISFFEIIHWNIFHHEITESTVHIVLETNLGEIKEFSSMYLRPRLILALIYLSAIALGFIYSYYQLPGTLDRDTRKQKQYKFISGIIILVSIVLLRSVFLPNTILNAVLAYQEKRKVLTGLSIKKEGNFRDVIHNTSEFKHTYLLIIGESSTRSHMELYGYHRKTNPLLVKRKHDLILYKHVISPHTHTISSLGKILTLGHYGSPLRKYNSTIIQLFNSAGYKTYWISNQKPVGLYETSTRLISKMSKKSVFTYPFGHRHLA
ncbi:MAG: sulfatase-like hydrolase/transferase [Bacteroidetes bacterium]|nr:sulfatase-like hydrolase/transferase [Bacteroidota bacterium]